MRTWVRSHVMVAAVVAAVLAGCATVPGVDDPIATGAGRPGRSTVPTSAAPQPATGPATPSPGCSPAKGAPNLSPFDGTRRLTSGGQAREVLLHVPPDLSPAEPAPLILDMHSLGANAALQSNTTAWNALADREGVVVAHPQGINNIWTFTPDDANPDLAFVLSVVQTVQAERCIDVSRTYATGWSMGGMLTAALACKAADKFAAFGFVAGMQWKPECQPAPARPAVVFWGSLDCVLPWFGTLGPCIAIGTPGRTQPTAPVQPGEDGGFPPVETVLMEWATHGDCSDSPMTEMLTSTVTHRTYQQCKEGVGLELYFIEGGGHSWPGSKVMRDIESGQDPGTLARQGITTGEIDATEIIWAFFQRYQLTAG